MSTNPDTESFRDSLSTVDEKGKRVWIYPKQPKGRFYNARTWVSIVLLILLFSGPLLKVDGESIFLFNILERKFIIFGLTFWPQDFHLFVLAMITFIVFIVLFTVVFGRVWCGWACPQTIFMELVYRRIEYWIEGDARQQKALAKESWTPQKIRKKTLKHVIFFAIAFLIGNTFLAYIVGIDQLWDTVSNSPTKNMGTFTAVVVFSGIFYGVFAVFREQACTVVCPYGRLQGAMLDKNSVVVAYDFLRGEPRGKVKKNDPEAKGDCVDCTLCVQVCPTGIDIRNGTQLECVNCTACMDACDDVMDTLKRDRGLIKLGSYNQIAENQPFKITTRIIGYSAVLLILIGVLGFSLTGRVPVETSILRARGMLYQKVDENRLSNLYTYKIANKTNGPIPVEFRLIEPEGEIKLIGNAVDVPKQGLSSGSFMIILDRDKVEGYKTEIKIGVYSNDKLFDELEVPFLGPG